ncbi:MAG: hypothetical protein OFPII_07570 [Osedax symbiont Rs1]|nr:MAG: hypothetical protein OFPII_07570 [Osedax symbiont Rs1]
MQCNSKPQGSGLFSTPQDQQLMPCSTCKLQILAKFLHS